MVFLHSVIAINIKEHIITDNIILIVASTSLLNIGMINNNAPRPNTILNNLLINFNMGGFIPLAPKIRGAVSVSPHHPVARYIGGIRIE